MQVGYIVKYSRGEEKEEFISYGVVTKILKISSKYKYRVTWFTNYQIDYTDCSRSNLKIISKSIKLTNLLFKV